MNFLVGLLKNIIPSFKKSKDQQLSVNGLLSKRGEVTKIEIVLALSEKILTRLITFYVIYNVVNNNVNIKETFQLLLT